MMDLQETLKDIKTQFRMGMNGVTSKSMRDKGLDYKLNFGVEVPRLKEIAARYAKDHQLAQALWKENIRESKILAAMLQPVDTFYPEIAEIWVEDMHYPELAELTCQHLFQYLPYASEKAFEWIADEREYFAACGYLILARLFTRHQALSERSANEYLDQVVAALQSGTPFVRRCAYASLLKYVQQGQDAGKKALAALAPLQESVDETLRNLYEEVKLETEG